MKTSPVILIFDVGKTNKKVILFDDGYNMVWDDSVQFPEITDPDGFPCDDLDGLSRWVRDTFHKLLQDRRFDIRAVNFSAYGASLVCLDDSLTPLIPLTNYLKPYPQKVLDKFYERYGGKIAFSKTTASPVLGSLNSGMQLYRIREEDPGVFAQIRYALHLPQYLSFLLTGSLHAEVTSIGCHTHLWDFTENNYHAWTRKEGVLDKFPPIVSSDVLLHARDGKNKIPCGAGLHDSSAALIPYRMNQNKPFILLSTGTWSITLNPFNHTPLTTDELANDCLCYLDPSGNPVKASRFFSGHEYDEQIKMICRYYRLPSDHFTKIDSIPAGIVSSPQSGIGDLARFENPEEAYYALMSGIVARQIKSTGLIIGDSAVTTIFVDGGFSKNPVYMKLLAKGFPKCGLYAASVPQGSALGAALIMHKHWNAKTVPRIGHFISYSNVTSDL